MTKRDPTDHALATIASILDFGDSQRSSAVEKPVSEEKAPALVPADVDGYFKVGPGPIEAIRFKWTVRRTESGEYFVDEENRREFRGHRQRTHGQGSRDQVRGRSRESGASTFQRTSARDSRACDRAGRHQQGRALTAQPRPCSKGPRDAPLKRLSSLAARRLRERQLCQKRLTAWFE